MELIYGTTNASKLASMQRVTDLLGIKIIGLKEVDLPLPHIEEVGKDPLENAIIKAKAYYKAFGKPVFSCDSGLYFEDVEDSLQPGIHVRRIDGEELDDDRMLEYYSSMAKKHNGLLIGRYRNAICLVLDNEHIYTSMDERLSSERFIMAARPHPKRLPGFPLDSLSIDIESGKYYYDLGDLMVDKSAVKEGFYRFFKSALFCDSPT